MLSVQNSETWALSQANPKTEQLFPSNRASFSPKRSLFFPYTEPVFPKNQANFSQKPSQFFPKTEPGFPQKRSQFVPKTEPVFPKHGDGFFHKRSLFFPNTEPVFPCLQDNWTWCSFACEHATPGFAFEHLQHEIGSHKLRQACMWHMTCIDMLFFKFDASSSLPCIYSFLVRY